MPLTIFAKSSISDVLLGSEYASDLIHNWIERNSKYLVPYLSTCIIPLAPAKQSNGWPVSSFVVHVHE